MACCAYRDRIEIDKTLGGEGGETTAARLTTVALTFITGLD